MDTTKIKITREQFDQWTDDEKYAAHEALVAALASLAKFTEEQLSSLHDRILAMFPRK